MDLAVALVETASRSQKVLRDSSRDERPHEGMPDGAICA